MSRDSQIKVFLQNQKKCVYQENQYLSQHTWYRIGGPADFLVFPSNKECLRVIVRFCNEEKIPYFILGLGANVLVSDSGFRGIVLKLTDGFREIRSEGEVIDTEAGVNLQDLILYCEKWSLSGLEYLSGIPGTIGGALIMNAGTDQAVIGDVITEVSGITAQGDDFSIGGDEIGFAYRSAPLLQDKIILSCRLKMHRESARKLREVRLQQMEYRQQKQPVEYPSCGSVFMRPPGDYAGRLIERAGLKGLRRGDAMVSEKHAGFIINLGKASAADVRFLIDEIQRIVQAEYGILLRPEVRFLGFDR